MSEKKPDVVFRRINGRVVPIKRKKGDRPNLKYGVAATITGGGIAAGAGRLEARMRVAEGRMKTKAYKQKVKSKQLFRRTDNLYKVGEQTELFGLKSDLTTKRRRQAARLFISSKKLSAKAHILGIFRKRVKGASVIAGGALLAGGISSLIPRDQHDTGTDEIIRGAAGSAAAGLFLAGTGSKNLRGKLKGKAGAILTILRMAKK